MSSLRARVRVASTSISHLIDVVVEWLTRILAITYFFGN